MGVKRIDESNISSNLFKFHKKINIFKRDITLTFYDHEPFQIYVHKHGL